MADKSLIKALKSAAFKEEQERKNCGNGIFLALKFLK